MLRLILDENAYTFYGFSYFFRCQTLRGGQGNRIKKRRNTQPTATKHPKEQKKTNNHLMSICAEVFSNATRIEDLTQVKPHQGKKYSKSNFSARAPWLRISAGKVKVKLGNEDCILSQQFIGQNYLDAILFSSSSSHVDTKCLDIITSPS